MACAQFSVWTLSELLFICFLPPVFPPFHLSPLGGLRARLHSSSSVPNFLKFQFLAPVQENEYSEPKHRYFHTLAQFVCPVRSNQQTDQNKELHCTKVMFVIIWYLFSFCAWCCFRDIAALSSPRTGYEVGESPLRSHRHSWRQQIFLRVATPQKSTELNGRGDCVPYLFLFCSKKHGVDPPSTNCYC